MFVQEGLVQHQPVDPKSFKLLKVICLEEQLAVQEEVVDTEAPQFCPLKVLAELLVLACVSFNSLNSIHSTELPL